MHVTTNQDYSGDISKNKYKTKTSIRQQQRNEDHKTKQNQNETKKCSATNSVGNKHYKYNTGKVVMALVLIDVIGQPNLLPH
jgi:hypothetical protein